MFSITRVSGVSVQIRKIITLASPDEKSLKAIHLPSGDQLIGLKGLKGVRVERNFRSGPPSAGTINIPLSAPAMRWNAICVPSGDQAALIHSDG
jgi:hypothetical protein